MESFSFYSASCRNSCRNGMAVLPPYKRGGCPHGMAGDAAMPLRKRPNHIAQVRFLWFACSEIWVRCYPH